MIEVSARYLHAIEKDGQTPELRTLINFGGLTSLSVSDYPGRAATVVFLRGCHHGCPWCHNKAIQTGYDWRDTDEIADMINRSLGFVSALVISGGEPLEQIPAVVWLAGYAHEHGLKVGLHTSGKPAKDLAYVLDCCHPDFVLVGGPNYDPNAT